MHKLLIVDDSAKNIQQIAPLLHQAGYNVAFATTPAQALLRVKQVQFDLYIIDVLMPEMDGFELWKLISKTLTNNQLETPPVLFVLNRTNEQHLARVFELEKADYVSRPILPRELSTRVHNMLLLHTTGYPAWTKATRRTPTEAQEQQQYPTQEMQDYALLAQSALHLLDHWAQSGNAESQKQAHQLVRRLYHNLSFLAALPPEEPA